MFVCFSPMIIKNVIISLFTGCLQIATYLTASILFIGEREKKKKKKTCSWGTAGVGFFFLFFSFFFWLVCFFLRLLLILLWFFLLLLCRFICSLALYNPLWLTGLKAPDNYLNYSQLELIIIQTDPQWKFLCNYNVTDNSVCSCFVCVFCCCCCLSGIVVVVVRAAVLLLLFLSAFPRRSKWQLQKYVPQHA